MYSIAYIKEKWQHAGFQKYLRNTGWMFFGRFFTLGISFFVGAYVARYLGPENYGLLNYVVSFVGLFGFLASFGIDGIISREIIKDHNKKDELIGTGFFIKLFGSLLAIITTFIVAYFTTDNIFTLLLILLFSFTFIPQSFNIIEIYFQSQVLSKNVVRSQIITTTIATILKFSVIFLNKGIFWLTLIYVIEASLFALFLLITFKYYGHHFRSWKFDFKIAKSILNDSWPLILSAFAASIYFKFDQILVKNILGNSELGIYIIAVKISEYWNIIPAIICSSVFPAIINIKNKDSQGYKNRFKKIYKILFLLSLFFSLIIFFFSNKIIYILYGPQYLDSINILNIYIWSVIPTTLGTAFTYFLLSENLTKYFLLTTFFGAITSLILNIIMIPKIGLTGAALSTLISYSLSFIVLFFPTKTRSHFILSIKSCYKFNN